MHAEHRRNLHLLGYEQRLNLMVDDIFDQAGQEKLTVGKLASKAGLAYMTVRNINDRITKLPRLKTVMLLARAVGLDFALVKTGAGRMRA